MCSPLKKSTLSYLEYLQNNLDKEFIHLLTSSAEAPKSFSKKKYGFLQPRIDYLVLSYTLPLELLDHLHDTHIFTKLNLQEAYNLVQIQDEDNQDTLQTHYGHTEYPVMPFGLCNAPNILSGLRNNVFQDILDQFVIIYLDYVVIFSEI